jgi:phospholipid/cholesterol/gamma-HCH transport system substrate-binding protein
VKLSLSREVKIGLMVIITLATSVWGFNFLKGVNLFSSHEYYHVLYPHTSGLEVSAPVVANGYKVGSVASIEYLGDRGGLILVKFRVWEKSLRIPADTKAHISTPGFLSSKVIDLRIGELNALAQPGDTLDGSMEEDLSAQVNNVVKPLKDKAERLISNIDSLIVPLQVVLSEGGVENLRRSFERIPQIIRNIEHATLMVDTLVTTQQSRISKIIGNIDAISTNFRDNNDKLSALIQNFSSISDSLKEANLKQLFIQANETLNSMNHIMKTIEAGEGTLGALVNDKSLYNSLDSSAAELRNLLEDVKSNPDRYIHFSVFHFQKKAKMKPEK